MLYLLKKDIKELFGNKKRIGILLVVLIILIISTTSNVCKLKKDEDSKIRFGVDNEDDSVYSKMLIEYFRESESFSAYINIIEGSTEELTKLFYQGKLDLFLQIPEGFAQNMIEMNHIPVKVLINTQDLTKAVLLKNILDSYEKYIRAVEVNCASLYNIMDKYGMDQELIDKTNVEISYDLIFTALGKDKFFDYSETKGFPSANLFTYYNYALISVFLEFAGLYAGFLMLKERRSGILKRLYAAGISLLPVVCEKIFFAAGMAFLLLLACWIPYFLSGNPILLELITVLFVSCLFTVSLSIFLSGLFYKTRDYIIGGNFLCFLFSVLGGAVIPLMYLPDNILKLSYMTPNYWLIRVMLSLRNQGGTGLIGPYILSLTGGCILFLVLAVLLYKRQEVIVYEE
ncbi:MAG: ABC transporter permease [Lachnoclostridium sp.]